LIVIINVYSLCSSLALLVGVTIVVSTHLSVTHLAGLYNISAGRWLRGLRHPRFSRRWNYSRNDGNWGNYLYYLFIL